MDTLESELEALYNHLEGSRTPSITLLLRSDICKCDGTFVVKSVAATVSEGQEEQLGQQSVEID